MFQSVHSPVNKEQEAEPIQLVRGVKREREDDDEEEPTTKKQTALDDLLGEAYETKVPEKSFLDGVETEVALYKSKPSIALSECPFTWWKERQEDFPLLSKSAKILLCIPATSIPSERMFSTAGDIITAQGAALSGENVDKLIFLKKNMKLT